MKIGKYDLQLLGNGEFEPLSEDELQYIEECYSIDNKNEDSEDAGNYFKIYFNRCKGDNYKFAQSIDATILQILSSSLAISRLVPRLLATIKANNIESLESPSNKYFKPATVNKYDWDARKHVPIIINRAEIEFDDYDNNHKNTQISITKDGDTEDKPKYKDKPRLKLSISRDCQRDNITTYGHSSCSGFPTKAEALAFAQALIEAANSLPNE
jgi:hypothetical protein